MASISEKEGSTKIKLPPERIFKFILDLPEAPGKLQDSLLMQWMRTGDLKAVTVELSESAADQLREEVPSEREEDVVAFLFDAAPAGSGGQAKPARSSSSQAPL